MQELSSVLAGFRLPSFDASFGVLLVANHWCSKTSMPAAATSAPALLTAQVRYHHATLRCCRLLQALHFGAWVWSLQHTSLAHSLLLVSTTPIILVAYSLVVRQPISAGEVAGAVLAVAGDAQQQHQQQ
jgi:drug/metabolite transporter (DMT)-like permease